MKDWPAALRNFLSLSGNWNIFSKRSSPAPGASATKGFHEEPRPSHFLKRHGARRDSGGALDVIFVHGLGGDPIDTWTSCTAIPEFWPDWLMADSEEVQIWTLSWPSRAYSFAPVVGLSIVDAANATLNLMDSHALGGRPIVFICHSMGGILVKQMLNSAATLRDKQWEKIVEQTAGVVFLATPHIGSALANIVKSVPYVPSLRTHELARNDSALRQLHLWYRTNAPALNIATLTFFETRRIGPIMVVDQTSADSDVPGSLPVAIDADHFGICKPSSKDDPVYVSILRFLQRLRPAVPASTPDIPSSGLVAAFRASYLCSTDRSIVFGGRKREIAQLNEWLIDEKSTPFMLVTGPTGRGKSALLVRWLEQLGDDVNMRRWKCIFVPISIRFGTSRPSVFYKILAHELAVLLKRSVISPPSNPEEFYIGEVSSMLRVISESAATVLVVVDGIDEAVGTSFNASIIPLAEHRNLKILLSARQLAGDVGAGGWQSRLGWAKTGSDTIELLGIDLDGVREAITSAGLELQNLPVLYPERLFELSGGEPLLVQLYVDDALYLVMRHCSVDMEQLSRAVPGYGAYISRWIEQQEQSWTASGANINRQSIDAALAVFSGAYGPLEKQPFISLVAKLLREDMPLSDAGYLSPIRRFVIGRGTEAEGYVLSHPKIGQFLREEYFPALTIEMCHAAFVAWGEREVQRANDQKGLYLIPSYLLQHYVDHMGHLNLPFDNYADLLNDSWARAWEAFEGGHRGYSSNLIKIVRRMDVLGSDGQDMAAAAQIKIRAALLQGSIWSIGINFPAELLRLALETELLTWKQVSYYIELQPLENRSYYYAETVRYIPLDELNICIESVLRADSPENRIQLVLKILPFVPFNERDVLLAVVANLMGEINNIHQKLALSAELIIWIPRLAESTIASVKVQELLQAEIPAFALAFANISAALERAGRSGILASETSWDLVQSISDPIEKMLAVWNIAMASGSVPVGPVFSEIVEQARGPVIDRRNSVVEELGRSMFLEFKVASASSAFAKLTLLACRSGDEVEYDKALNAALYALNKVVDFEKARVLTELIPMVRSKFVARMIESVKQVILNLPSGNNRLHAYIFLAKQLEPVLARQFVQEALNNANLINDEFSQIHARIALYGLLPFNQKLGVRNELLAAIAQVSYVVERARLYTALSEHEDSTTVAHLSRVSFELIQMAADPRTRISEIVNLLSEVAGPLRTEAFNFCMKTLKEIADDDMYWVSVSNIFGKFGDLCSRADFDQALANKAGSNWHRQHVLPNFIGLAHRFGAADVIAELEALALGAADLHVRLSAVRAVLPYARDESLKCHLLDGLWSFAASKNDQSNQASVWLQILSLYPGDKKEKRDSVKKLIFQLGNGWQLLETFSLTAPTATEKEEILDAAFTSGLQEKCDSAVQAAISIATNTSRHSVKLKAFDFVICQSSVPRVGLLNMIQRLPDVVFEIGGVNLLRKVGRDIAEVGGSWR
jgi:pimeloyl-ACP methyl ester carboxylesterase